MSQFLLAFFTILILYGYSSSAPNKKDIVDYINSLNTTFTAYRYPQFVNKSLNELRLYSGGSTTKRKSNKKIYQNLFPPNTLKEDASFDAAKNWPYCETINKIEVQGNCASSWAISVATTIRDRRCIANISFDDPISAWNLVSCCTDCQLEPGNGCNGGTHADAVRFFINSGIVTGGSYSSSEGCQPYPISPETNTTRRHSTHCYNQCRPYYKKSYEEDKVYGEGQVAYSLNNQDAMVQIRKFGPIVAQMDLYEDFLYYKEGIYQHEFGKKIGQHYVKIVGWGVDYKGLSYWKAVNSYGENWGEKGAFRILRGKNEVNFETDLIGPVVKEPLIETTTLKQEITTPPPVKKPISSITCKNVVGYFEGRFEDENGSGFDGQFQLRLKSNEDEQKVYLTLENWNKTYSPKYGQIDLKFWEINEDNDKYNGCETNSTCSIPFRNIYDDQDYHLYLLAKAKPFDKWQTIIGYKNFENKFVIDNTIDQCTNNQSIFDPFNYVPNQSKYKYCLCCGDNYNPDSTLKCPASPWKQ